MYNILQKMQMPLRPRDCAGTAPPEFTGAEYLLLQSLGAP
jgi:hypothetical protein